MYTAVVVNAPYLYCHSSESCGCSSILSNAYRTTVECPRSNRLTCTYCVMHFSDKHLCYLLCALINTFPELLTSSELYNLLWLCLVSLVNLKSVVLYSYARKKSTLLISFQAITATSADLYNTQMK